MPKCFLSLTEFFHRYYCSTSILWILKFIVFPKEKQGFLKNRLSKITSISASILVPTCLHVGLQNRRFSEIMAFQEGFKISSFLGIAFLSILGPSWPPTWSHLGGQDGSKSEKMGFQKFWGAPPCWFLIRHCFWTSFKKVLASILGGSGLDFWMFLEDFWRLLGLRFWGGQGSIFEGFWMIFGGFLAYFGRVFGCSAT